MVRYVNAPKCAAVFLLTMDRQKNQQRAAELEEQANRAAHLVDAQRLAFEADRLRETHQAGAATSFLPVFRN